ncbi:MAG: peptide MFS transporter, partial [Acidimicrobiales bacterium]
LQPAVERAAARAKAAAPPGAQAVAATGDRAVLGFTPLEWKRVAAVGVFFVFAAFFWAAYEQAGSTLNLFADRHTRLSVLGWSFPSSWFQSVQALFVITLAPVFAWLWVRLGPREPSTPAKFALGLLFAGLSFALLVPAGALAQGADGARVSPLWLVGAYGLSVLGELCLSPVGNSVVTKLAPVRVVGMMMGVWFLAIAAGNKLAGWSAGFFETLPLPTLFGAVAGTTIAAAVVLWALVRPIRRLMGGVH